MYKGRYANSTQKGRKTQKRGYIMVISLLAVVLVAAGSTLAFLMTNTAPVENVFQPSEVTVKVTEKFDGQNKTNVNVVNTGDIDAYVRVRLLSYRVNDSGDIIGGTATIPEFTPGEGWVKSGDHYYYTKPVSFEEPNNKPETPLIASIALTDYVMRFKSGDDRDDPYGKISGDLDEGKQVIEVIAEAVQAQGVDATGVKAVVLAWGVDPETLK